MSALTAIVAFHSGAWGEHESVAEATARGFGQSCAEFKTSLGSEPKAVESNLLAAINSHIVARGGPEIHEISQDACRPVADILSSLFDELPNTLTARLRLFQSFRDYLL